MENPVGAQRHAFMATLPSQMISVGKSPRASMFETIVEESLSLQLAPELAEECVEVAPALMIAEKKQAFQSTLDTIWEDTMHFYMAEYFNVSEAAAEVMILPPVWKRANHFENLSHQFCIDSSSGAAPVADR